MKLLIAGIVALLALPSLAAAEDGRQPRGRMRAAVIAKFDANGDGRLQPEERRLARRAIHAKRMERMGRFIERFDTNRDGNVGPGEMPSGQAHRLRRFDRNGDGWVQPGELRQPRQR